MQASRILPLLALVPLALVGCDDTTGPNDGDFDWSGSIAQGDAIEIKGINGDLIASVATGNTVMVTAAKEGLENDPAEVHIDVVTHEGGVTICAVYPDAPGQPANECAPGDDGHLTAQDNDVTVTFWISVPAGVDFVGETVNGSVSADDLESDAFATTVNGNVTVGTTQLAAAQTVNGSITIDIGLTDWGRDLAFLTVNGHVTVEVPAATNADVRLTTANGTISSDFPLTQVAPGDVRGTIGSGGRFLRLTTVNGNVMLERGA